MDILEKNKSDVRRALGHLQYSFLKVRDWDLPGISWSEEKLEVLESFSSRFARTADLVVTRLLRGMALAKDPAFRGPLLDLLNFAERERWIDSARTWFRIRELRNIAAHEYANDDLQKLYAELIQLTPSILAIRSLV